MDIGHRMKELRIQYGLTQQELADRAELTKGFISQLERNQNSPSHRNSSGYHPVPWYDTSRIFYR